MNILLDTLTGLLFSSRFRLTAAERLSIISRPRRRSAPVKKTTHKSAAPAAIAM